MRTLKNYHLTAPWEVVMNQIVCLNDLIHQNKFLTENVDNYFNDLSMRYLHCVKKKKKKLM